MTRLSFIIALLCLACSRNEPTPAAGPSATTAASAATGASSTTAMATAAPSVGPTSPASTAPAQSSTPPEGTVSAPACLDAGVRWQPIGGNASPHDSSTADLWGAYRLTRTFFRPQRPPLSCSAALPCDASETGAGKLKQLLGHPDVETALTSPMTIYGCDGRAVDASLFHVEVDGGRSFAVGSDCKRRCGSLSATCVDPPAAVRVLVEYLQRLDATMKATDACKLAQLPQFDHLPKKCD